MKRSGFTLAEVLVTLTIIGIVAALTIPTLIQNTKSSTTYAGILKAQSVLSQAYTYFEADGATMDTVFAGSSNLNAINNLATKLNVVKNCGVGPGCFPNVTYKWLNNVNSVNYDTGAAGKLILADGTSIAVTDNAGGCTSSFAVDPANPVHYTCGQILVDINGFKGPNQWGRDMFAFFATRTGIFPYGRGDTGTADCATTDSGTSCAFKVITEGGVNY